MKVAILNNDFRAYWKNRLVFLRQYLTSYDIDFYAIELFGKGSPYSFDEYSNQETWWSCLFQENSAAELPKKNVEHALFKALDAINPDIIIAAPIVLYAGALGLRWAKTNKRKFIMFDDARPNQFNRNFLVKYIKNTLIKQADGLWFPSNRYFADYAFFQNKRIHFFYGFSSINNLLFKPAAPLPLSSNTIICVARLVPVKNIANLLRAWKKIEEAKTNYKLSIIGNGSEFDNLIQLKNALDLTNVDFLGAVANNQLAAYYQHSDAFVLPSLSETWGLVVNEAMAAGLPVLLSSNVNATRDLLVEGQNGFSFNPHSIDDMAGALLKFIKLDIQNKHQMSASSLKIIDSMSYEKMGIQLKQALLHIVAQKVTSRSLFGLVLIMLWSGGFNTTAWDK